MRAKFIFNYCAYSFICLMAFSWCVTWADDKTKKDANIKIDDIGEKPFSPRSLKISPNGKLILVSFQSGDSVCSYRIYKIDTGENVAAWSCGLAMIDSLHGADVLFDGNDRVLYFDKRLLKARGGEKWAQLNIQISLPNVPLSFICNAVSIENGPDNLSYYLAMLANRSDPEVWKYTKLSQSWSRLASLKADRISSFSLCSRLSQFGIVKESKSEDRSHIILLDIDSNKVVKEIDCDASNTCLDICGSRHFLAVGDDKGQIGVISRVKWQTNILDVGKERAAISSVDVNGDLLAYSLHGKRLEHDIGINKMPDGKFMLARKLDGRFGVSLVCLSSDCSMVSCVSDDGVIHILNTGLKLR